METRFGLGVTAGITAGLVILAVSTESLFAARNPNGFLPLPQRPALEDSLPEFAVEEIPLEETSEQQAELDSELLALEKSLVNAPNRNAETPEIYGLTSDEIRMTRAKSTSEALSSDDE